MSNDKMSNRTFFLTTLGILTIGLPLMYWANQLFWLGCLKGMQYIENFVNLYF